MVKKKLLWKVVGVGLVLLLALAMAACQSKEAPQQGEADGEAQEEAQEGPVGEGESVSLSFSTWHPPVSQESATVWEPMLQELKERSNGRIDYTTYFGGALGAAQEHYDIVVDGMSDMGYFTATFTAGRFPLSDVLSMPAMVLGKDVACDIGNEMYELCLHEEFPEVKMLSLNGCVSAFLWTKEPVRTLEDAKGLRIRTPGGLQTYMIEAIGAEPVFMPLGDVYLSMETGVLDGIVTCPMLYQAYNFHELGKYAVVASFGCVTEGVVMNKNSWEKLPDDLKPLVEEVVRNPFELTGGLTEDIIKATVADMADEGVEFYELPQEEAERWYSKFTEDIVKKWVNDMDSQGLPGKEVLLQYKAVLDKNGVEFPSFPPEWEAEVDQYR